MRKSTKKIQEIHEFLAHTDWVYIQARLFVLITMTQGLLGLTPVMFFRQFGKKLPQGANKGLAFKHEYTV